MSGVWRPMIALLSVDTAAAVKVAQMLPAGSVTTLPPKPENKPKLSRNSRLFRNSTCFLPCLADFSFNCTQKRHLCAYLFAFNTLRCAVSFAATSRPAAFLRFHFQICSARSLWTLRRSIRSARRARSPGWKPRLHSEQQ